MKVIAFVWNRFDNDGRVYRECKALVDADIDTTLICLSKDNKPLVEWVDGIKVIRVALRLKGWLKSIGILLAMIKMIKIGARKKADLYHANDLSTLVQGFWATKLSRKKAILIYDSHEIQRYRHGRSRHFVFIEGLLIHQADIVIVTNQYRKEVLQKIYKNLSVRVLHNYPLMKAITPDPVDFHQLLAIPEEKSIVLYQGGFQEGRGLEKSVRAMVQVDAGVLVMIGRGPIETRLKVLVKELDIENKVKFMPMVPYGELHRYTMGGDIGLQLLEDTCLNHKTALSNKLFEYMNAEVPVIASDIREIAKVVNNERVGIVLEETSPKHIANAIRELIGSPERMLQMKINAREAKVKYDWQDEQKVYLGLLGVELNGR